MPVSRIWRPALVVGSVLACYQGVYHFPFQFDDNVFIVTNRAVTSSLDIGAVWANNPARFLTFLSLAINHQLGGLDVSGYHVFNVAIHVINSLLVLWLAGLIRDMNNRGASRFDWPLATTLVFAVHPLQTQAVTYIWQRNTSLAAMFYILSLGLYLTSARAGADSPKAAKRWLAASLVSAVAAMFTKQFSVTLPLAIVAADYFFVSGSLAKLKERASRLALFIPVFLVIPILTALNMNEEVLHIGMRARNMATPGEYLLTQFNVIAMYLRLLVLPINQNLDYEIPLARALADCWPSLILLMTIAGAGLAVIRRNRPAAFGVFFFFLALSVESSFFPLEDMAFEHRMYLPMAGVLMAVFSVTAQGLGALSEKAGGKFVNFGATAALVVITVALGAATIQRNQVWRTEDSLWKDVIGKSPGKARGYVNLGVSLLRNGKTAEAKKLFEKAVALQPEYPYGHFNLGVAWQVEGGHDQAIEALRRAVGVDPNMAEAHLALANSFFRKNLYMAAGPHYVAALNLRRDLTEAYINLGSVYLSLRRPADAIKVYESLIRREPGNAEGVYNLGVARLMKGDKAEGMALIEQARLMGFAVPGGK
ncbi:MAG: tetratricopeptide repeat protein [Nitrospinae bacterium]|nr:tetratricopeptide repeat protein [Nitrospinota bacterium]